MGNSEKTQEELACALTKVVAWDDKLLRSYTT